MRSEEPRFRDAIADGYARSATFRELVDTTEALSCIVYIAPLVRLSQGMRGALLLRPVGLRQMPVLRVLVKASLSRDAAIEVIAHELQHVVEAITGAPGGRGVEMEAVFAKLDATRARKSQKYETAAAVDVTWKVRGELSQGNGLDISLARR